MGLDQAGHQRRAGAIHDLRSVGRQRGAARSERLDAVAVDQDLTGGAPVQSSTFTLLKRIFVMACVLPRPPRD